MCSIVGAVMENNNYQGDLTDIIRSSYASCSTTTTTTAAADDDHWNMFFSDPVDFSCCVLDQDPRGVNFGDPFSNARDPFLHMPPSGGGGLEEACFGAAVVNRSGSDACGLAQQGGTVEEDQDVMGRPPCNMILSNMIQISPISPTCASDSPRAVKPPSAVAVNADTPKDHCLVDNARLVQISSSPKNPPVLKRRKSQVKKSICIPAPAALNSRQSGEVVPSDLWAWRKYGQKPIKGSPYPRGYYRCSSSKGCPARKQVERSRTDPNMLVITYTSEHNHPWPTQRNALAGSSRSQPSKNNINNNNNNDNNAASKNPETIDEAKPEEEQQESNSTTDDSNVSLVVKEEIYGLENKQQIGESTMVDDGEEFSDHGGVVLPNYKASSKVLKCNNSQLEDLFAELGEMEGGDDPRESKGLDPFHVFDWSGDNTTRSYHHQMHI